MGMFLWLQYFSDYSILDEGAVDLHQVGLIMEMLSVSYKKAVDIWKVQCLAQKEMTAAPQRRKPAGTLLYPEVSPEDQQLFAGMSDVQRHKYLAQLQTQKNKASSTTSRSHKKQGSFKQKAWEQASKQLGHQSEDEDMPPLTSDSSDDVMSADEFDAPKKPRAKTTKPKTPKLGSRRFHTQGPS